MIQGRGSFSAALKTFEPVAGPGRTVMTIYDDGRAAAIGANRDIRHSVRLAPFQALIAPAIVADSGPDA